MKLNMLAIEASDRADLPETPVFRWLVHHVREAFIILLPKEFELDGSSKIQITCGPKGNNPQYLQLLGTSQIYDEAFTFDSFFASEQSQRDVIILTTIEMALIRIAELHKKSAAVCQTIRDVSQILRQRDFALKVPISRLSKATPCRKSMINVFRCLDRIGGETWCLEISTNNSILHTELMTKKPDYLNRTDFFKTSVWEGNILVFRTRLGKVVFQFDASQWIEPDAVS